MSDVPKVLITGASRGFGRLTAEALAERGAIVHATMPDLEGESAEAARELRAWAAAGGHALHVAELDVTDEASVERAVGEAVRTTGLDVVVNNAGVGSFGLLESFTPEQLARIHDVNVIGAHRVNRAALPHLRAKGRGLIVFLSSGLGRTVLPFMGPYAASKHALEALAETLECEVRPLGIEVVIIEPGTYATNFRWGLAPGDDGSRPASYGHVAEAQDAFRERLLVRHETSRIGDPSEVVDALVEVVYAEPGTRPLRRPVGDGQTEALRPINWIGAQVRARLFQKLGIDEMLRREENDEADRA